MAVGSSNTIHLGSMATTPAMATLCFCPPESLLGECFLYFTISTARRLLSTRFQISSVGTPIFSGPNPTSSSTTLAMIWLSGFWNTIPAVFRMGMVLSSSSTSMPSTQSTPSLGVRSALICFASVDFPEPLCPRMAINCPALISRFTWSNAVVMDSTFPSSSLRKNSCTTSFALIIPILIVPAQSVELSLQLHMVKMILTQCLIQYNRNRIGQIQRACLPNHGNPHTGIRICL